MGFKKTSELDPALGVNDNDLFAGVQEHNNQLENIKYTAEQLKLYFQDGTQSELTFDNVPVENSNNPVKSGGLYSSFATKQDLLTFDSTPMSGSSNPVTSNGIRDALSSIEAKSIPLIQKGERNGVAELDSSGKVPSSQLPSYVDDVEEYLSRSVFPVFGEGGKIYIALDTNLAYRWTGSGYAEISPSLALGETSSTAYRGDRGKAAYTFSKSPYDSAPSMDGSANAGSSDSWARGDHVHPKDSSKQDALTFDNAPVENSNNPVKSGGLYSALATKQDVLTFDNAPVENSNNPVKSGGLYSALATKQDVLTFDDLPEEDSDNPVKSSGLRALLDEFINILFDNNVYATDSSSGAPASFSDGAAGVSVRKIKVNISPIQEGTGDPSSSNIRPISGFTETTIIRVGKNLYPPYTEPYTNNNVTLTPNGDGSFTLSGSASSNNFLRTQDLPFPIAVNAKFSFSLNNDVVNNEVGLRVTKSSNYGTLVRANAVNKVDEGMSSPFAPERAQVVVASNHGAVAAIKLKPQLELGNKATKWEAYTEESVTISWIDAGTVYGGELDVTNGVLTVTHGYISSYDGETLPGEWISDRDVYAEGTSPSTGAQVVYELSTPVVYSLTPANLHTVHGVNHIFSDAGTVDVEYRADIKLYMEKKFSTPDGGGGMI